VNPPSPTDRVTGHVTCLGCGCACDDIQILARADRIVEARNACSLGAAWFGDGQVPANVRVADRDVSVEDAIDAAATLLARAARPLVYLAPDLSCEAQREAVGLADGLGGVLDSITSATAIASLLASQERGRASATLGELRNRADVVVFWGIDPALRYPRYWTRYAPDVAGLHVPDGRRSRKVVAVDIEVIEVIEVSGDGRGPSDADTRVAVPVAEEVATITALTALVSAAAGAAGNAGTGGAGIAWTRARELAAALSGARYAAIVADAEPASSGIDTARDSGRAAALIALAQALNGPRRCALSLLRGGGNRSGADAVATWQTGYPVAVDFARGFPRYLPHDGTAGARLAAGEVDALLLAGSAALVPAGLLTLMARVPAVVVGPRASESALAGTGASNFSNVVIDTGIAGIHEGGTAMRMDDVPLPLLPSMSGPTGAAEILRLIGHRVRIGGRASREAASR
jgi:formylmethanofuran dehydrogenase subunit B